MNHSTVLRSPHDGRRFTNVVLLLTGQTLSLFGSSIVQYAIFRYLVLRSNSGMVMTGAMVAAALPQAIVSVSGGGVWADRWNRKLLVMLPDAVIAAVTICLSASMAVGWDDTGLILVVLVIRSAGDGIQTPAVQSFIPADRSGGVVCCTSTRLTVRCRRRSASPLLQSPQPSST